eukprot:g14020.t1
MTSTSAWDKSDSWALHDPNSHTGFLGESAAASVPREADPEAEGSETPEGKKSRPPGDVSDSNDIPLSFIGCDEHFATRWEHGELLGRGALLKPDSVILSLKSRQTLQQLAEQQGYPTDANSVQRVYFTSNGRSTDNVRTDLDRLGYQDHILLPYHCVLPMEYNFFVEYKTGTQLLDMMWNEQEIDETETTKSWSAYNRDLRETFGPESRFNLTRDLVAFTQMSLPAKVLHWPGENRKPWERVHVLARSQFDQLWWDEYEAMARETSGGTTVV